MAPSRSSPIPICRSGRGRSFRVTSGARGVCAVGAEPGGGGGASGGGGGVGGGGAPGGGGGRSSMRPASYRPIQRRGTHRNNRSGGRGIRTPGGLAAPAVFKAAPFVRSGI